MIGSGCVCIWFGVASTYGGLRGTVIARGVSGGWNSIVGVTKTLAIELAYHDVSESMHRCEDNDRYKQETRVVGLIMSMRAWSIYWLLPLRDI